MLSKTGKAVGRYILAEYSKDTDEKPRLVTHNDSNEAKNAFEKSGARKVKSSVLYDSEEDRVMKIAIEGEPKNLTTAIESARTCLNTKFALQEAEQIIAEEMAADVIDKIAKALLGEPVPGISDAVMAHFLGPYYAIKGDEVRAVEACAGLWGGVSGAVLGMLAGPGGAAVGGFIGATTAAAGAGAIIKAYRHPRACKSCKGTGLVDDFRTCDKCNGYGYKNK